MKKRNICVFLAFLVFLSVSLSSCKVTGTFFNSYRVSKYADEEKYQTGNFTYQSQEVKYIDIDWGPQNINIIQSEADVLSVNETGELNDDEKMHYLIENGVLKIKFWKSDLAATIEKDTKEITVEIPKDISIKVSTISGNLISKGFVVDELVFKSTSGDIYIDSLVANKVDIGTVSGKTRFDILLSNTLKVESTSGNVNLKVVDIKSIDYTTVSGDLNLKMKKNIGFLLEYSTVSGKLNCQEDYNKNGGIYSYGDERFK